MDAGKYIFILYDAAILLTAAVTTLKNLSKHKYIVYFPNKEFKCILTYLHIHIHTCIQIKIFKSSVAFPIRLCFVCKVFFFLQYIPDLMLDCPLNILGTEVLLLNPTRYM